MGSHSVQAVALTVFLVAFTILCAGFALGGSVLLILVGVAGLAGSMMLFWRCKQLEESNSNS